MRVHDSFFSLSPSAMLNGPHSLCRLSRAHAERELRGRRVCLLRSLVEQKTNAARRARAHNNTWTERILVCSCFFQLKLTWQIIFNLIKFYDRFMEQTATHTRTHARMYEHRLRRRLHRWYRRAEMSKRAIRARQMPRQPGSTIQHHVQCVCDSIHCDCGHKTWRLVIVFEWQICITKCQTVPQQLHAIDANVCIGYIFGIN